MLSFQHDASPSWENVAISATGIQRSGVKEKVSYSKNLKVFPDPVTNELFLEWREIPNEKNFAQLLTVDGVKLREIIFDQDKAKFETSKLPTGVYQILILSDGHIIDTMRVVILH